MNPPPAPDHSAAGTSRTPRARRSLTLQLTLIVAAIVAMLLGVLLLDGNRYWREIVGEQIDAQLSAVAESRRNMVLAHLAQLKQRAEMMAEHGQFRGLLNNLIMGQPDTINRNYSQGRLDEMADGKRMFSAMLADAKGRVLLASKGTDVLGDVSSDPAFTKGMSGIYVGPPCSVGDHSEVVLAAPVRDYSRPVKIAGVLMMTVDVSPLAAALRDTTGLGQTGEVLLGVREAGQMRFLFPPRHRHDVLLFPLTDTPAMAAATNGRDFLQPTRDYRGEPVLAAGRPIGYGGWGLVAKMDEAEAHAPILGALRHALWLGAAIMLVGLAAAWMLARRFSRPISQLAAAAESVARGELDVAVPVASQTEVGVLAACFNEMTAALRARTAERETAELQLAEAQRQLQQHAGNLENTVRERTEKLREIVEELEAFSYSIAHDMRAPLRAMTGFSDILLTDHAGQLDETGRRYLQHIAMAARRMDTLIVDILNYSKVVRGELEMKPVNVEQLIREITTTYPALGADRADITVASPLPRVLANGAALTQVVSNLLGNAVKFVAPGVRPYVCVRAEKDAEGVRLWFEDNGIGIAKDAQARLFHIFTRLHGQEEYEGTGIGLAIVRKAAERMGGSVGLESEEGRGSQFWIRLKEADDS